MLRLRLREALPSIFSSPTTSSVLVLWPTTRAGNFYNDWSCTADHAGSPPYCLQVSAHERRRCCTESCCGPRPVESHWFAGHARRPQLVQLLPRAVVVVIGRSDMIIRLLIRQELEPRRAWMWTSRPTQQGHAIAVRCPVLLKPRRLFDTANCSLPMDI